MLKFPINNTMFMTPQSTPESAWLGHIPFAGWLVEELQPRVFVELGTHRGASYLAFCQAIQRIALQAKCFAVDSWEGDEHAGEYGQEIYLKLLDFHQRNYADFSRLMKMQFDEAVEYFEDQSIDLLHIDGLHTYEAVRNDFETWLPKLSTQAVVLFHDVNVREREFGVWRYWNELKERYPSFEFTHTHGLGVLLVGSEQSDVLQNLCDANRPEDAVLVNRLFDLMGRLITANIDIGTLAREQGRLATLLNEARSSSELLVEENAVLKHSCSVLDVKVEEQRGRVEREIARNGELSVTAGRLAELAACVERLEASNQAEIERNKRLSSAADRVADLTADMEQLQANYQNEVRRNIELSTVEGRCAELVSSMKQLKVDYQVELDRNREFSISSARVDERLNVVNGLQSELVCKTDLQLATKQMSAALTTMSDSLLKKDRQLEEARSSCQEVTLELERMRMSLSWRLTALFRALRR
jgi:hypothetical protein